MCLHVQFCLSLLAAVCAWHGAPDADRPPLVQSAEQRRQEEADAKAAARGAAKEKRAAQQERQRAAKAERKAAEVAAAEADAEAAADEEEAAGDGADSEGGEEDGEGLDLLPDDVLTALASNKR